MRTIEIDSSCSGASQEWCDDHEQSVDPEASKKKTGIAPASKKKVEGHLKFSSDILPTNKLLQVEETSSEMSVADEVDERVDVAKKQNAINLINSCVNTNQGSQAEPTAKSSSQSLP